MIDELGNGEEKNKEVIPDAEDAKVTQRTQKKTKNESPFEPFFLCIPVYLNYEFL